MIRLRAMGTEFKLHALTVMTIILSAVLCGGIDVVVMVICLIAHEAAHIAAARLFRLSVVSVDFLPFGGSARIEGLNRASAFKVVAILLAGPLMNLLLALMSGVLGWLNVMPFYLSMCFVRSNIVLFLFNLLPALPLDGSRILIAVSEAKLGRSRAVRYVSYITRAVAALCLLYSVHIFCVSRMVNLSLVIFSVFLTAYSISEREAAYIASAERAVNGMSKASVYPSRARIIAIDEKTPSAEAAKLMREGETTLFAVFRSGEYIEIRDERWLNTVLLNRGVE